jgi:hypothetical protein
MRYLLPLAALLALFSPARAAGPWTLTTADFRTQSAALDSIDAAGVHVSANAGEKVIPFDQFLDLTRPVAVMTPTGKFLLVLIGDDHISGEPVRIKGNDLIWSNSMLGEIAIPMKRVIALTRPGSAPPPAQRKEDVVTLANGDSIRGIVADFADGKVSVQADAGNSDVPLTSISQISFSATPGAAATLNGFRVRFDDGSTIVAESLKLAGEKVELLLRANSAVSVDVGKIAAIEQSNGPVSWLSARPPSENIYIPFIGSAQTGAAKMNRNWTGLDPIRFGTQEYGRGIGVHSYSRLSWPLDGSYEALRTLYAIDTKDANTRADVTVRILLDDKVVYEQAHVRAGTLSPVIIQDLKGAKKLTLEVDYGDNMDTQDRLNWIEPALLKHKPK